MILNTSGNIGMRFLQNKEGKKITKTTKTVGKKVYENYID